MDLSREVSGYVLAGGRSSRMGRDKALLNLGGKPLIEHAVSKLRQVCGDVAISGSQPALGCFAPLVLDEHVGCGPVGGMEAALAQTRRDWNLFVPVDVPFLPVPLLKAWISSLPEAEAAGAKVSYVTVGGFAQPTVALLHREVRPFLAEALQRGELKLLPALERAAGELAYGEGKSAGEGLWKVACEDLVNNDQVARFVGGLRKSAAEAQRWWFANLNTPEEFAEAERQAGLLEP